MQLEKDTSSAIASGLKVHMLARPMSMIAASPELAARHTEIQSAADLLKAPLLDGRHTDDWRWWFTANGVNVPEDLPGELCWHPYMALEATRLGRGVLLGNRFFFERDLADGHLVELNVSGTTNSPFGGYTFVAQKIVGRPVRFRH